MQDIWGQLFKSRGYSCHWISLYRAELRKSHMLIWHQVRNKNKLVDNVTSSRRWIYLEFCSFQSNFSPLSMHPVWSLWCNYLKLRNQLIINFNISSDFSGSWITHWSLQIVWWLKLLLFSFPFFTSYSLSLVKTLVLQHFNFCSLRNYLMARQFIVIYFLIQSLY
jgi:hypothetical protein